MLVAGSVFHIMPISGSSFLKQLSWNVTGGFKTLSTLELGSVLKAMNVAAMVL